MHYLFHYLVKQVALLFFMLKENNMCGDLKYISLLVLVFGNQKYVLLLNKF